MPLSEATRRTLKIAFASKATGDALADVIDAGTATLLDPMRRKIRTMFGSKRNAANFITAVEAATALDAGDEYHLAVALADKKAAREIAAALEA